MATPAEIQASADSANTMFVWRIEKSISIDATYDSHYVTGICAPYAGRSRWCNTTKAGNAAAQVAEINAALTAN